MGWQHFCKVRVRSLSDWGGCNTSGLARVESKNRSHSRNLLNEGLSAENVAQSSHSTWESWGWARGKKTDQFKKDSNRIEWFTKHESFSSLRTFRVYYSSCGEA